MPSATLTVMIANVVKTIAMIGPTVRLPKMMAVISAQIRPGVVTPMVTASRKNPLRKRFCIRTPTPTPDDEGDGETDRDARQRRGERPRYLAGRPQFPEGFEHRRRARQQGLVHEPAGGQLPDAEEEDVAGDPPAPPGDAVLTLGRTNEVLLARALHGHRW